MVGGHSLARGDPSADTGANAAAARCRNNAAGERADADLDPRADARSNSARPELHNAYVEANVREHGLFGEHAVGDYAVCLRSRILLL